MGRIIGNGDIATFLREYEVRPDLTFFASGVSNSKETKQKEFIRELDLLALQPRTEHLVYFSSIATFFTDSPYFEHKRKMEKVVRAAFPLFTIVRIGNITWGKNPNTLINYLKAHPDAELKDEYRYIVDEEELAYWLNLIPKWSCEITVPGKRLKVKEVYDSYCRPDDKE